MINDNNYDNIDIFRSVKSEAINELTPAILDSSLDLIVNSEILKDIPIFGTGFKIYSLYNKITEAFFAKKLLKFLFEIKDVPVSKREKFVERLKANNETSKAGEQLLIVLTRLNDIKKAAIIGRLLNKTILGDILLKDFQRLCHIIDSSYIEDILLFKNNELLQDISDDIKSNLHQIGLLNQTIKDDREKDAKFEYTKVNKIMKPILEYRTNRFSEILIEFGFGAKNE